MLLSLVKFFTSSLLRPKLTVERIGSVKVVIAIVDWMNRKSIPFVTFVIFTITALAKQNSHVALEINNFL